MLMRAHAGTDATQTTAAPLRGSPQAKLRIGLVDDPLEREADRGADAVVADRFAGGVSDVPSHSGLSSARIPPSSVHRVLASPGEPLAQAQRDYFEPRFGRDLSGVFVHRDAAAGRSADALSADAYTFKNHIVFGAGRYTPGSATGRHLLAHELGHTIQQLNSAMPVIQRRPNGRPDQEASQIGVVSITTYEGSSRGQARLSDGATVEVELVNNALPIGEHRLLPVGRVKRPKFQGDDKFMWRIPADPLTGDVFDGLEPVVTVYVQRSPGGQFRELSSVTQELITSPGGRQGSAEDIANAALAGQVLENALTPDELLLLEVRRREKNLNSESGAPTGDPLEFALGVAAAQEAAKQSAGDNWAFLVQVSKMLAKEPIYIIRRGGLGNVLDPGSYAEKKAFFLGLIHHYLPGKKFSSAAEIEAAGKELFEGFQTILGRFETALVADLRNLAETALDAAEARILRMDRQYVGIWQTKVWSEAYFWREVERIKKNEAVSKAAGERDKIKRELDEQQDADRLQLLLNPITSLVGQPTTYGERTEAREKEKERQDQLFNETVAEQSNLKVSQAGNAQHILEATNAKDAVDRLRDFLWYGRNRITGARERIKDRKVLYAADKIIEVEKAQLKGPLGSDAAAIEMVIDAFAKYRKSQTSLWEDIFKIIEFVAMFVPGPIGWGLRFGTAVVGFDRKMEDISTRRDLHGANLSTKSVGSGEVTSALLEAGSQVALDVPAIGKVAKGERLALGVERGADEAAGAASRTASGAGHGTPQGLADDVAAGSKIPDPPSAAGSGATAGLAGDAAGATKVPERHWTDFLPEAQRRTQAAKAKHGDSLIMMAIPGSPDRQLIRRLAAQGTLSRAEMRAFIEALMREHPVLGQLANAQRLTGAAQRKEMLSILDRVYRENKLAHEVVPNGVVGAATQPGNMASLRSSPGILQIEQRAYDSTEQLAAEVTHELSYFFSRSGGNVPTLGDLFNGLDVLELTIRNGGRYPFPP